MKIAYCSDLHMDEWQSLYKLFGVVDFATLFNTQKADVLCISGDIAAFKHYKELESFFKFISKQFKMIFIVPGNHEYYFESLYKDIEEIQSTLPKNIIILNNSSYTYKGVIFYGGIYWPNLENTTSTELHAIQSLISDFLYIEDINITELSRLHKIFVDELWETIYNDESTKDIVVLSHFPPTEKSVAEEYKGNVLNDYFTNKNDNIPSEVRYWICGHVHNRHEYSVGNTRVLCNPRGYPSEHNKYILRYIEI